MRIYVLLISLLFMTCLAQLAVGDSIATVAEKKSIAQARTAIRIYAHSLKKALVKAMKKGGPVAAISLCHTEAMPITRRVSVEQGLHLSRVSLKNRNPLNAPNKWQKAVLDAFAVRKLQGEDVGSLSYATVIKKNGVRQFRYMQAIPVKTVCLPCHGKNIAPEIKRKLAQLYPHDRATGFDVGDIRGAFVVTKILQP